MNIDFESLYVSHYGRVYGLCRRLLGRPSQAEDAAQEVFMRAYKALDRYDQHQPFANWVLGIASRYCIDLLRRRSREAKLFDDHAEVEEYVDEVSETAAARPTTLESLVADEQGAQVKAAIGSLPDNYRVPLVLAYYNEWSYDEIATHLGVTRNHVGVLLLRAKRALRRVLDESGQEPRT